MQAGDSATASKLAVAVQRMTWGLGYVPEQAWEDPNTPASPFGADPTTASIGFTNGKAAGSATPLVWGQAQYLRLIRDLQTKTLLDQPGITRTRYVTSGPMAAVPVTLTPPAAGATAEESGKTAPGALVDIAAGQPGPATNATTVVATVADAAGNFGGHAPVRRDGDHGRGDGRAARHRLGSGDRQLTVIVRPLARAVSA
jgi:glucoamylase